MASKVSAASQKKAMALIAEALSLLGGDASAVASAVKKGSKKAGGGAPSKGSNKGMVKCQLQYKLIQAEMVAAWEELSEEDRAEKHTVEKTRKNGEVYEVETFVNPKPTYKDALSEYSRRKKAGEALPEVSDEDVQAAWEAQEAKRAAGSASEGETEASEASDASEGETEKPAPAAKKPTSAAAATKKPTAATEKAKPASKKTAAAPAAPAATAAKKPVTKKPTAVKEKILNTITIDDEDFTVYQYGEGVYYRNADGWTWHAVKGDDGKWSEGNDEWKWAGVWDGKALDTSAPEPERADDLDEDEDD